MQIDQTERHVIENRGARHTLIIRKVHPQDFGNYSCIADNQLGKTRKTVTLTGKPKTAVFRSVPNSQWKDKYNISWIVDSHSPIEEFKLYYRQVDGDTLQAHDGIFLDNRKLHHSYAGDNVSTQPVVIHLKSKKQACLDGLELVLFVHVIAYTVGAFQLLLAELSYSIILSS